MLIKPMELNAVGVFYNKSAVKKKKKNFYSESGFANISFIGFDW